MGGVGPEVTRTALEKIDIEKKSSQASEETPGEPNTFASISPSLLLAPLLALLATPPPNPFFTKQSE